MDIKDLIQRIEARFARRQALRPGIYTNDIVSIQEFRQLKDHIWKWNKKTELPSKDEKFSVLLRYIVPPLYVGENLFYMIVGEWNGTEFYVDTDDQYPNGSQDKAGIEYITHWAKIEPPDEVRQHFQGS